MKTTKWTAEYTKEYNRLYQKAYYIKNKEKVLKRSKEYARNNPTVKKKCQGNWRAKNRETIRAKQKARLFNLDAFLARKLSHLKKNKLRARTKELRILEFSITTQDLINLWKKQNGKCAISGYAMTYPEESLFAISVDRINPSQGYVLNNIQLVCQGINFCKNKFTNDEMIDFWNRKSLKE